MNCPECGVEDTAADQHGHSCSSELNADARVDAQSNADWLELVRFASDDNRHYFTANTLYLAYARGRVEITRFISRRGKAGLVLIVLGLATWVYALKVDWGYTLVGGIFVTLSGVAMVGTGVVTKHEQAPREPVTRWLEATSEPLDKLLREPGLANASTAYLPAKTDCLVIVDRDLLVDLLLRNGAHHELSALVVAESGYPRALTAEARRVLAERPDLKVIALHDATPEGVGLCARLANKGGIPVNPKTLVDAGLFPAEVNHFADLASAIPNANAGQVALDSLRFETLLEGLRGIRAGKLSISA